MFWRVGSSRCRRRQRRRRVEISFSQISSFGIQCVVIRFAFKLLNLGREKDFFARRLSEITYREENTADTTRRAGAKAIRGNEKYSRDTHCVKGGLKGKKTCKRT